MSTPSRETMERRIPAKRRVRRELQQSPSPSPRHLKKRRAVLQKQSHKSAVPEKLKRCKSEPIICTSQSGGDDHRRLRSPPLEKEEELLFRPQTCMDIFISHDYVLSLSPPKSYQGSCLVNKDAKVVVSVTVEGSPGPIRAMVKLSCTVDEAIRIVVRKYNAEGRTPALKLKNNDDASNFELYSSYFSLQGLNKADVIGDIGSRIFYLRKTSCKGEVVSTTTDLDTISNHRANTCLPIFAAFSFLPGLNMSWKIQVMRRTCKFWRILGCLSSG